MQPTILSIAGSDSSGGAGAQADLKAIAACGAHGACVLTAVTAQSTQGVDAQEIVSPGLVLAQMDTVFADLDVVAVKTGMLGSETIVEAVAEGLQRHGPPALVVDPVIVSTSGHRLLTPAGVEAMVERLFPLATVVTPNVDEAEMLSGLRPRDAAESQEAGRRILDRGARAVLIKGGHLGGENSADVLVTPAATRSFRAPRIDTQPVHGTGCVFSAAIATHLGHGHDLEQSIALSKELVGRAIRSARHVGRGAAVVEPLFALSELDVERMPS